MNLVHTLPYKHSDRIILILFLIVRMKISCIHNIRVDGYVASIRGPC